MIDSRKILINVIIKLSDLECDILLQKLLSEYDDNKKEICSCDSRDAVKFSNGTQRNCINCKY